jgi:hypothetical protein
VLNRNRPGAELNGSGPMCQWWVPTAAGHERMVFAAGFEIIERSKPYCIGYGTAHPPRERNAREFAKRVMRKVMCGMDGVPQSAVLARPRV